MSEIVILVVFVVATLMWAKLYAFFRDTGNDFETFGQISINRLLHSCFAYFVMLIVP